MPDHLICQEVDAQLELITNKHTKNKFTVNMQTDLVEYLIKIIEVNLLNIK